MLKLAASVSLGKFQHQSAWEDAEIGTRPASPSLLRESCRMKLVAAVAGRTAEFAPTVLVVLNEY